MPVPMKYGVQEHYLLSNNESMLEERKRKRREMEIKKEGEGVREK